MKSHHILFSFSLLLLFSCQSEPEFNFEDNVLGTWNARVTGSAWNSEVSYQMEIRDLEIRFLEDGTYQYQVDGEIEEADWWIEDEHHVIMRFREGFLFPHLPATSFRFQQWTNFPDQQEWFGSIKHYSDTLSGTLLDITLDWRMIR